MKPTSPTVTVCVALSTGSPRLRETLSSLGARWSECVAIGPAAPDLSPDEFGGRKVLYVPEISPIRSRTFRLALDHVSAPWALLLEDGEVISEKLARELPEVMKSDSVSAGSIRVKEPTTSGLYREQREVRLLRPMDLAHVDLSECIHRHLHRSGTELVHLEGAITAMVDRRTGNQVLGALEGIVASDATDLHAQLERLDWARCHGDHSLWRRAAKEARQIVEDLPPHALEDSHAVGDLLVRISQAMPWVRHDQGLEWLDQFQERLLPSALYQWWRGHLREAAGDLETAEGLYRESLHIPSVRDVAVGAIRPRMGLGRIAMARGALEEAERWTGESLALAPRDAEALLSSLTLARQRGGEGLVETFIEAHIEAHGNVPELWVAVGQDALHRQDRSRAIEAFARAAGDPPRGRAALRLARALLVDARPDEALEVLQDLTDLPESRLGILACHLCLGEVPDELPEAEDAATHYGLRDWVVAVLQSRSEPLVTTLVATARKVATRFPWLITALTASTGDSPDGTSSPVRGDLSP